MGHSHDHHDHHAPGKSGAVENIGYAFFLNLLFAAVELAGGLLTGSIAIIADALHDLGDSFTLALAWTLQKFAANGRSTTYTYGLGRLSLLSSLISGFVLFGGSVLVLVHAVPQLWNQDREPHGWGMLALAVFGVLVNGFAAFKLSHGKTRNEKMLSWHMIEDLLGWVAVLVGAIVILLTGWPWVDPMLAIAIALFIGFNVIKNLWETIQLFLQKVPDDFSIEAFEGKVKAIEGVTGIHDVHVWTMDGERNIISLHLELLESHQTHERAEAIKTAVRAQFRDAGDYHTTIEIERSSAPCDEDAN